MLTSDDVVAGRLAAAVTRPVGNGTDGDRVGGVAARWVVTPADTAEVSAVLAATVALDLTVVARGSATTLSWGAPPTRLDVVVDTTALVGIVEHVAGDLVVAVRAGTRLVDLQAALAQSGQRLALDGEHGAATVGGLLAHAVSGPSRLLHGTLRDLLIGATMVRSDGVVAHSGGKVVKNVAGYDLGKLLHGSWGTLGILTEAVFRLHPVPAAQRWVTVPAGDPGAVGTLTQRILAGRAVPAAVEIDRPAGGPGRLAVMVEGPEETTGARAASLARLLGAGAEVASTAPPWWGRRPVTPGGVLIRVSTEITGLDPLQTALDDAAADLSVPAHVRGSSGVGALMVGVPASTVASSLRSFVDRGRAEATRRGGTLVVLDGPVDLLHGIDRWGPVAGIELMHRIKDRFDPGHRLAPGRWVGGI